MEQIKERIKEIELTKKALKKIYQDLEYERVTLEKSLKSAGGKE